MSFLKDKRNSRKPSKGELQRKTKHKRHRSFSEPNLNKLRHIEHISTIYYITGRDNNKIRNELLSMDPLEVKSIYETDFKSLRDEIIEMADLIDSFNDSYETMNKVEKVNNDLLENIKLYGSCRSHIINIIILLQQCRNVNGSNNTEIVKSYLNNKHIGGLIDIIREEHKIFVDEQELMITSFNAPLYLIDGISHHNNIFEVMEHYKNVREELVATIQSLFYRISELYPSHKISKLFKESELDDGLKLYTVKDLIKIINRIKIYYVEVMKNMLDTINMNNDDDLISLFDLIKNIQIHNN